MVIGNIKNKISNFQNLFNIPAKANADSKHYDRMGCERLYF
jgi:hypothetical protein